MNCHPPYADRPDLVLSTGPASDPPLVLAGRTTSLAGMAEAPADGRPAPVAAAKGGGARKPVKSRPTLWES